MALVLDVVLGSVYLGDLLLGQPIERLSRFIDLDGEVNFPTWFASVQWFAIAALLWIAATGIVRRSQPSTWVLIVLPPVFLLFSLDEVAELHEGFGGVLDRLVLDVPRSLSVLPKTGVLVVLFGIPFAVAMALVLLAVRSVLSTFRSQFLRVALGLVTVLVGGLGVEALSNFIVPSSLVDGILVLIEEMLELVGATFILWGSHDLARDSGAIARAIAPRSSSSAGR